jgi:hypothetical protein
MTMSDLPPYPKIGLAISASVMAGKRLAGRDPAAGCAMMAGMRPEDRRESQRITREIGDRAYAIYRQPWRILRNRRLRREVAELLAEGEQLFKRYRADD